MSPVAAAATVVPVNGRADANAHAIASATSSDWDALGELVAGGGASKRLPCLRIVALTRLVSAGPRRIATIAWKAAAADTDTGLRLRAAQLAPRLGRGAPVVSLLELLADADAWVAEAAAYALGEHPRPGTRAATTLADVVSTHDDPLVREAAVASLGAIGDPRALPAVLRGMRRQACDPSPRRARAGGVRRPRSRRSPRARSPRPRLAGPPSRRRPAPRVAPRDTSTP